MRNDGMVDSIPLLIAACSGAALECQLLVKRSERSRQFLLARPRTIGKRAALYPDPRRFANPHGRREDTIPVYLSRAALVEATS
jgi:hypothetical protein